jgi:hypothetical protein
MKKNWKQKQARKDVSEQDTGTMCSCYLCEHPEILDPGAWTKERITADIKRIGWSVAGVLGDKKEPPWAYTVGLWQSYRTPELVVGGVNLETSCEWLNQLASKRRDGESVPADTPMVGPWPPHMMVLRQVHDNWMVDLLAQIQNYYGTDPVPVEQVVWSDHHGRFPREPGFPHELRNKQPMLWMPKDEHPMNVWRGHGLPARG